jgi:hypothetical protein
MILKAGEGDWIIINDKIFTTPNKENRTLQLHPPADFFLFFLLFFPLSSRLIFGAEDHVFVASFQREQLALWKERK